MAVQAGPGTPDEGVSGLPVSFEPAAPPPSARGLSSSRGPAARYFVAIFLSLYGDWLTTVALLVVVFELTHNPAAPAGYMLVRVAPRFVGPWLGGQLADRLSPRRVLVSAAAVQTVVTLSLIGAHRAGLIWALYLAVALAQFVGALARPSQGAILPSLVGERTLARANATYGLFFSTSIFVAPAIGAALLVRVGPDPLFAIDAASFAVAAALFATLPRGDAFQSSGDSGRGPRTIAALRMALSQGGVRMVAAANFASGMTVTVTQALLVVAAHERFGGDAAVGYLYSSVGVGGAVGGLVALRWIPARRWTRFAILVAITLNLMATAAFAALAAVLLALLMLALSAVVGSSLDTWGMTEVQREAPPGLMGRYNSIVFISMYSGMLVGALWALGTSSALHWDVAIEVACAAMLVLVGAVWLTGGTPMRAPE